MGEDLRSSLRGRRLAPGPPSLTTRYTPSVQDVGLGREEEEEEEEESGGAAGNMSEFSFHAMREGQTCPTLYTMIDVLLLLKLQYTSQHF